MMKNSQICPECGYHNRATVSTCRRCQTPLPAPPSRRPPPALFFWNGLLAAAVSTLPWILLPQLTGSPAYTLRDYATVVSGGALTGVLGTLLFGRERDLRLWVPITLALLISLFFALYALYLSR